MKYNKAQFIWGPGAADKLTFDLDTINPTTSYVVKSISGLEPPSVNVSVANRLYEGGVYQGRRPENREIVMLMSFQPNYFANPPEDAGTLRKKLYLMMSPRLNNPVRFRLLDDAETDWVETTGYIKRMENNIFSKDPEIQITMSCLSAYFSAPEYVEPNPTALGGKTTFLVENRGDAPTGYILDLTLTAVAGGVRFRNAASPVEELYFDPPEPSGSTAFLIGDRVVINTTPGARSALRIRSGVDPVNLISFVTASSVWWLLDPGVNSINFNTSSFTVNSFRHTPRHWGF